jgi:hypothetical protein
MAAMISFFTGVLLFSTTAARSASLDCRGNPGDC